MAGMVIAGGSQAGMQVAVSLREKGYEGPVTIISEEPHYPYQRPPLSKAVLAGKSTLDNLQFRNEEFYRDRDISVLLGVSAVSINRQEKTVRLSDDREIPYDKLAITTGARVRTLPVKGAECSNVFYLRGIDDAVALKAALETASRAVVIGGGFIGLEAAASMKTLGKDVTVIEAQERLLERVMPPVMSDYFNDLHESHGIALRLGAGVSGFDADGETVTAVRLSDGETVPADLVLIGIGVVPNSEIAANAGLDAGNGIIVDEFARTSDPDIVSAGDVAFHHCRFAGADMRLESVQNAIDQAKIAAGTMLGEEKVYDALPWFWSDQFDVKLQMAGLSAGYDDIVLRGSPDDGAFTAFYYRGGDLIGVDTVNRPGDHMAAKRILSGGPALSRSDAADASYDLKVHLRKER